jgi:hypothetical protein
MGDLQAGHSSAVANRQYGISNLDHRYVGPDAILAYYMVSLDWHKLLGVCEDIYFKKSAVDNTRAASLLYTEAESSSAGDSERVIALASQQLTMATLRHNLLNTKFVLDQVAQRGTTPSGQTMSLLDQTSRVQGVVVQPSTAVGLRQLLRKPDAQFKSPYQATCVQRILDRAEDLLYILPAGGGQSLRLMLPA